MNPTYDPNYVLIDTEELKRMYAPKRKDDEFWDIYRKEWCHEVMLGGPGFDPTVSYRRHRDHAWIEIAKHKPIGSFWMSDSAKQTIWVSAPFKNGYPDEWTHWQPAPDAPKPPVDEDEAAFQECYKIAGTFRDVWFAALRYAKEKRQ